MKHRQIHRVHHNRHVLIMPVQPAPDTAYAIAHIAAIVDVEPGGDAPWSRCQRSMTMPS
jgi:hypothetical protein